MLTARPPKDVMRLDDYGPPDVDGPPRNANAPVFRNHPLEVHGYDSGNCNRSSNRLGPRSETPPRTRRRLFFTMWPPCSADYRPRQRLLGAPSKSCRAFASSSLCMSPRIAGHVGGHYCRQTYVRSDPARSCAHSTQNLSLPHLVR